MRERSQPWNFACLAAGGASPRNNKGKKREQNRRKAATFAGLELGTRIDG